MQKSKIQNKGNNLKKLLASVAVLSASTTSVFAAEGDLLVKEKLDLIKNNFPQILNVPGLQVNKGIERKGFSQLEIEVNTPQGPQTFDAFVIDGIDVFSTSFFEGREEKESYERYFEATLNRIRQLDCFNTFAHLDYVVRYGPNKNKYYSYEAYRQYIDPILELLIKKDKALECNAGGYRRGLGQPNPSKDVFKRYYDMGGRLITIGSDAHKPEAIGYPFDDVAQLLSECGFKEYAVYKNRKPEFYPIL